MNKVVNKLMSKSSPKVMLIIGFLYLTVIPEVALANTTAQVQTKLKSGLTAIQTVLTSIAVIVGVIAGIKIFVKAMPGLDDPHVKSEMWKSIGGVGIAVVGAAAVVWIVPWLFNIFT